MNQDFIDWLNTKDLTPITAKKYESGLRVISEMMQNEEVVARPLENMKLTEFNSAYISVTKTPSFISKNSIGHNMYKRSLDYFAQFLQETDRV